MRLPWVVFLASIAIGACESAKTDASPDGAQDPAEASADAAPSLDSGADAGRGDAGRIAVTAFQTSVVDRPAWPETGTGSKRLGYLRQGTVLAAYERAIPNDECKDGWYELLAGGFVCGKAATADMSNPRVRLAPHPPDRDAGLPYRYGVNLVAGTPLYRRVLSVEDRKKYEPELAPPKPTHDDAHPEDESKGETKGETRSETKEEPTEADDSQGSRRVVDAGAVDAGKPRLKDLRGRGVLVRRMERGFYLALDRDFKAAGAHWWRTTFGFAVPFERIMLQPGATKHVGAWFEAREVESDAGAEAGEDAGSGGDAGVSMAGTVGFVTAAGVHEVKIGSDGKISLGPDLTKRTSVLLTGRTKTTSNGVYHEADGGFWVRLAELKLARPAPPADLAPGEKWIDVDLTRQALLAFEGTRPVFATLISSGRKNAADKEHQFPTPTGTFHIREKHVTTTMDGDIASDGPYSIEDVPWVMYFQGSYALHGAFWHDAFGYPRSHGCVNLAPEDARALFAWADPPLPPGWHGVTARGEKDGTRVVVHEDPPPRR